jgi:3-hydroxybutyryl-CoA dehydratase
MRSLHFSDLQLGFRLPPVIQEVTQEVIDRNAAASLDYNPVHTDVEWCRRARVFGTEKTVGHGMFTMSLMASVISREWYSEGAWIERMDSKFTKPVEVGRTIRCEGTVIEVHPRGPGRSFVVVKLNAFDGGGDTVAVGSAHVRIPD